MLQAPNHLLLGCSQCCRTLDVRANLTACRSTSTLRRAVCSLQCALQQPSRRSLFCLAARRQHRRVKTACASTAIAPPGETVQEVVGHGAPASVAAIPVSHGMLCRRTYIEHIACRSSGRTEHIACRSSGRSVCCGCSPSASGRKFEGAPARCLRPAGPFRAGATGAPSSAPRGVKGEAAAAAASSDVLRFKHTVTVSSARVLAIGAWCFHELLACSLQWACGHRRISTQLAVL
jgi:hypothetical protein